MSINGIPRELGRYVLCDQIAAGGMATVHFGRMQGAIGFSRLVAIKRLHPNYAGDPHFVQMFFDEARLAARLDHPNVVSTIDVVADENEVFLVMEHVLGDALESMMPREGSRRVPPEVASSILCGVLEGLHSAHEARGEMGEPLDIVHRDVSPHNILVGVDGVARVFDFGIAKATINTQETREGVIKGKVTYMAPEQVRGVADRRADIYATGVILWELLAGRRRHAGERNDTLFLKLAKNELDPLKPPSSIRLDVPIEIDEIVARATDPDPDRRFSSAREMAVALEAAIPPAPAREVSDWVYEVVGSRIDRIAAVMRRIETEGQAMSDARMPASMRPSGSSSVSSVSRRTSSSSSVVASLPSVPSSRMVSSVPLVPSSSMMPSASTASMHVVTATIHPSARPSSIPLPFDEARISDRPVAPPPPRAWTMPAALLAFTAALLLVGLRILSRHDTTERGAHSAAEAEGMAMMSGGRPQATVESTPPSATSDVTQLVGHTPEVAMPPAVTQVATYVTATATPPPVAPPPRAAAPVRSPVVAAPVRVSPPPALRASPRETNSSAATPRAEPASAPPAAAQKAGCENPFAISADGIRQIKPECM